MNFYYAFIYKLSINLDIVITTLSRDFYGNNIANNARLRLLDSSMFFFFFYFWNHVTPNFCCELAIVSYRALRESILMYRESRDGEPQEIPHEKHCASVQGPIDPPWTRKYAREIGRGNSREWSRHRPGDIIGANCPPSARRNQMNELSARQSRRARISYARARRRPWGFHTGFCLVFSLCDPPAIPFSFHACFCIITSRVCGLIYSRRFISGVRDADARFALWFRSPLWSLSLLSSNSLSRLCILPREIWIYGGAERMRASLAKF